MEKTVDIVPLAILCILYSRVVNNNIYVNELQRIVIRQMANDFED